MQWNEILELPNGIYLIHAVSGRRAQLLEKHPLPLLLITVRFCGTKEKQRMSPKEFLRVSLPPHRCCRHVDKKTGERSKPPEHGKSKSSRLPSLFLAISRPMRFSGREN